MTVPNVPFWVSAANQEFQKHPTGWVKQTGTLARINRAFWASELAGKSDTLPVTSNSFDISGYTPGVGSGGAGPRGIPGTISGRWRSGYMPMVRNYVADSYGGSWHCNRDMAFFGEGIREQDLLNAGLVVSECIGTNRALQFESNAVVDDEVRFGYLQFHKDSPWSTSFHELFFYDYDDSGREWSRVSRRAGTPPANYIWVPAYWNNTGYQQLTMRVYTV